MDVWIDCIPEVNLLATWSSPTSFIHISCVFHRNKHSWEIIFTLIRYPTSTSDYCTKPVLSHWTSRLNYNSWVADGSRHQYCAALGLQCSVWALFRFGLLGTRLSCARYIMLSIHTSQNQNATIYGVLWVFVYIVTEDCTKWSWFQTDSKRLKYVERLNESVDDSV